MTHPGVGPLTALAFVLIIGTPQRFPCGQQMGSYVALSLEPLEIEQWLKGLKRDEELANPTLDKIRRVISLVFKHGQRYGLISRNQESNPMHFVRCKTTSSYEAMILTPKQAFDVLMHLHEPERTLALLACATGLRISECLGLQWQDVNFEQSQIHVRRTWTCGQVGLPKSRASHAPVPPWRVRTSKPARPSRLGIASGLPTVRPKPSPRVQSRPRSC